jgi:branched-chain amino acid transport system ATP-binding protein
MPIEQAIVVEGLEVSYGAIRALQGVSMAVDRGSITCVVGNNGAGKSTLMGAIVGKVRTKAGTISIAGEDIGSKDPSWRVKKAGIALVPEGRGILFGLSVAENLRLGEDVGTARRGERRSRETREKVLEMFPVLGDRIKQHAGNLSGGEQQMLAIGRALLMEPDVLLLDEPSMGLAPLLVQDIFRQLRVYVEEQELTVLLVEQNTLLALELSRYAYVLDRGIVELEGPAQELSKDPRLQEAYLGIEA